MRNIINNILKDLKVELMDEFDMNFQRKAFFNQPWATEKFYNRKGSQMARTNTLRRSLKAEVTINGVKFFSNMPYADIHNSGGAITVTEKMKRYFWAKFRETSGAIKVGKKGAVSNTKSNMKLSQEAMQWRSLALQKTGSKMNVPKRQFIGWHDSLVEPVKKIIETNIKEALEDIAKKYKR